MEKEKKDFIDYEEARKVKNDDNPAGVSDEEVESATEKINPDDNTKDRG